MMETKQIVTFPERELKRYQTHGIAHLRIADCNTSSCFGGLFHIDLTKLNKIKNPAYANARLVPNAPEFVFYSGRSMWHPDSKPVPAGISELEVKVTFNHPKEEYDSVAMPQIGFVKHR